MNTLQKALDQYLVAKKSLDEIGSQQQKLNDEVYSKLTPYPEFRSMFNSGKKGLAALNTALAHTEIPPNLKFQLEQLSEAYSQVNPQLQQAITTFNQAESALSDRVTELSPAHAEALGKAETTLKARIHELIHPYCADESQAKELINQMAAVKSAVSASHNWHSTIDLARKARMLLAPRKI